MGKIGADAKLSDNAPNTIQPDDAASAGVGLAASRDDHEHAIVGAAPSTVGSANSEGSSTSFARADHIHAREHAKYTDGDARTAAVSDAVYGAGWNGVTTIAASKNAVYDKIETLGAATKEFFVPATQGTESINEGSHPGYRIDAAADEARIIFYVPDDFSSITEVVVTRRANASVVHRLNYRSEYGALGEGIATHSASLLDQDTAETAGRPYEEDISSILGSLAVGDYVGIRVTGDATSVPDDHILGVRFKYA